LKRFARRKKKQHASFKLKASSGHQRRSTKRNREHSKRRLAPDSHGEIHQKEMDFEEQGSIGKEGRPPQKITEVQLTRKFRPKKAREGMKLKRTKGKKKGGRDGSQNRRGKKCLVRKTIRDGKEARNAFRSGESNGKRKRRRFNIATH